MLGEIVQPLSPIEASPPPPAAKSYGQSDDDDNVGGAGGDDSADDDFTVPPPGRRSSRSRSKESHSSRASAKSGKVRPQVRPVARRQSQSYQVSFSRPPPYRQVH